MEKDDRFSSPPPPAIDFSFAKAPSFKPRSQQNQADKPESTRSTPGIFSGPSFSPAERVKYSSLRAEVRPPRSSPLQRSAELSAPAALPAAIPTDTKHVSFPSFRTQQHAAVSSSTPEKPEDPTLPSLHSNRGQFGGSAIELPSPLMKIPPSNSLSYSTMSTPSTKERLLQRKRQSMGNRNVDSPMSPSPHIQPLSSSNHGFPLLTGTSRAQLTHHQNETRLNSSGTCLPDVLTPNTAIANVQRKQEPPSSRHTSLARDSNSIVEAGSSGNRSLSHVPPESNPGIGLAFDMIKNMEEENVRLKADVHELSSRLESVQAEADGLSAKNKALQHRSKEAVETAAEALDANYKELQVLKAQCASQTTALEELKAAKSDFGHLREHVQASLAEIRPLIDVSDEALGQSTIARQIVSDIRNEVQTVTGESERKQHVVDLLREQLMSCTGDLSEARDRVLALEMELSKSRMTLDKTVDEMNMATSKIYVLANELKGQQHETISALTRAGELQASLTTAEAEILDLRTKFQDSDALNHKLRTDYAVLQQTHQQIANEASRIPNLEAQLQSLSAAEATLKSKDEFISDLQTRLASSGAIEAEVKARDNTIAELRALLNSAEASERANKARIATLERAQSKLELVAAENVELQKAAERSRVLETNLVSTKKELETEKAIRIKAMRDAEVAEQQKSSLDQALQSMQDKLQRSNTRYEISEQRRVDQVEDLNNRIVTYETQLTTARENLSTYSSQVASLSASLAEIRLVVDKREAEAARLQDVVRTHASTNAEQTATITQLRAELKEQSQSLKSVESLHTTHQARVVTLERELRESGERLAEATTKLQASEAEISSLKAEAQAPRQDDEVNQLHAEVESVRKRAEAAEAKIAGQEEGFKTMVTRFRAREQLSDLETSVIRDVVPLVRAQCQTELLTRINEIKGRDTTISKLTTRIAQLEAQLDKALKGSEAAEVSLQNGTSGTGGGFQPLEVSTPLSDPPVPDADQVTTDSTPPSPPPTTRPISYAVPQGVPGRHYGSSRPAAAIARHRFTELNKPSLSSEDAIQGASSDDIAHSKAQGPGVRKVKRTHDDMEYDDEIEEDEDENVMPLKSAASKTRTTKSTRRPSVQGKPPVAPSLATGANNAGASKTRGKKRR